MKREPGRQRHQSPVSSPFDTEFWNENAIVSRAWAEEALALLNHVKNESAAKRQSANEPRRRTRRYINALRSILGKHPSFAGHEVRADLAILSLALEALDGGVVHDLVRKRDAGNRPHETSLSRQFRLLVLESCQRLISAGMKRADAYRFLAQELTAVGVTALKPSATSATPATFKAATIKRWYERTIPHSDQGKDAERRDDAEWLFVRSFALAPEGLSDAQSGVREWLRSPIFQSVLPRCAKLPF